MNGAEEYKFMKKAFEQTPRHRVSTKNNGFIMALFYTKYYFERYCLRYSEIENYNLALADNFKDWHCHHKLEEYYTREELILKEMYYNRPPEELIFLTKKEHQKLHCKYNKEKGFFPSKGHHWKMPRESVVKHTEMIKNSIWVNNGIINKRVPKNNIPIGFIKGRIKNFNKNLHKGKTWIINAEGKREWKEK